MKLRIKGNSLRLRITPSEMTRLLESGRIEETIHFRPDASLTYALLTDPTRVLGSDLCLTYQTQEVAVVIAAARARQWAAGPEVGVYADIDTGAGTLQLAVEKDFACLDNSETDNRDTFPHPAVGSC